MAITTYTFKRQIGGRGAFARVAIEVKESRESFRIEVGESLTAPMCHVAAAIFGIEFAREQLICEGHQSPNRKVTVVEIVESPADTLLMHVVYAACHAYCDAVGIPLKRPIEFDGETRTISFPLGR